jgi:hypothetical protein
MTIAIEGRDFWQHQLESLNTSGLTRSQYCRENNINYDRFGYWLKRLSPVSSEFVPVKLHAPELPSPHSALCTLELRGHILNIHDLSALSFVLERLA